MKRRMAVLICLLLALCAGGCAETFLISSDLHLTADGEAHEMALAALRAAAQSVDALILLGDNTNNARDPEHDRVKAFLASLGRPAYVIPGNHDVTLDISDFIGLYADCGWSQAFSRDEASASCAVMTGGGTCLLLLDTNDMQGCVAPLGGISEGTCTWVKDTLSRLAEGTPVVACGHHPILPAERWERTPGAAGLVDALSGVRLYLCGHDHGFAAVKVDGLQQITVGQPHAYPGWAGLLEVTEDALRWQVLPLYSDQVRREMRADAIALAEGMARGTLRDTPYADDEDAIQWFVDAFEAVMTSQLREDTCAAMLSAPAARKWRRVKTRTVVKRWIMGILEDCPQDVRRVDIRLSDR